MTLTPQHTALVTGASSGIGECLAYDLARAGCKLVLSSRKVQELERVKKNCIGLYDQDHVLFNSELDLFLTTYFSFHLL